MPRKFVPYETPPDFRADDFQFRPGIHPRLRLFTLGLCAVSSSSIMLTSRLTLHQHLRVSMVEDADN